MIEQYAASRKGSGVFSFVVSRAALGGRRAVTLIFFSHHLPSDSCAVEPIPDRP
jgi:hypothetical protein